MQTSAKIQNSFLEADVVKLKKRKKISSVKEKNYFRIERFSIKGEKECSNRFKVKPDGFEINKPYRFTYLSHCQECTILQEKKTYKFYKYES